MLPVLVQCLLAAPVMVWSSSASVPQGGRGRFETRGVSAATHYTLVTRVVCEVRDGGRRKRWREHVHPNGNVPFGVEFRVFLGAQEFPSGVGEGRTTVRVDAADPVLTVEDRSSPPSGRTRCRLSFIGLESL
ncbi:MAG: hypothetical protein IAE78_28755 [Myxococcus sp.]|nr:hypothetical protein [Myxococcus sp.]